MRQDTEKTRRMLTEELAIEDTMDYQVGQNMPQQVLEHILTFLPLPNLCRFRAVSKEWNRMISEPRFQANRKCATQCLLLSANEVKPANASDNWEIQDIATDKHYLLNQDFLHRLPMVKKEFRLGWAQLSSRRILATNRGFMCVLFRGVRSNKVICVVNPVTGSAQKVPCLPPKIGSDVPEVSMVVSKDLLSFKLFVTANKTTPTSPSHYSLDSRVGKWRPKIDLPDCPGFLGPGYLQTFFTKHFNVLHLWDAERWSCTFGMPRDELLLDLTNFSRPPPNERSCVSALWSMPSFVEQDDYDTEWMIPMPLEGAGRRIFLTVWADHDKIVIWEVDVLKERIAFLAESSVRDAAPLVHKLGADGQPMPGQSFRLDIDNRRWEIDLPCKVVSMATHDDRIIFASVTGAGLAFSCTDHTWSALPPWKNFTNPERFEKKNAPSLYASFIDLTLCPVPPIATPRRRCRSADASASTSATAV